MAALIFLCAAAAHAQVSELQMQEPESTVLGAPLYPGAMFIRIVSGLDPYHETAMYITIDDFKDVEKFFSEKLNDKRMIYYQDRETYMTAFLLHTWSEFPGKPDKDDIMALEKEPNVQIHAYDPNEYEALAEYYDRNEETKTRAAAIRIGETIILYNYRKPEKKDMSSSKIIGEWNESDRDLAQYYGAKFSFTESGKYTLTLTEDNITAMASELKKNPGNSDKTEAEIASALREANPEKGTYVIMRNHITLETEKPLIGDKTKTGLADVGTAMLSLELINMPRLTFIRSYK